jgi:hypothetical protein
LRCLIFLAALAGSLPMLGEAYGFNHCLPDQEFAPGVVKNFSDHVSFDCVDAAPFDLIRESDILGVSCIADSIAGNLNFKKPSQDSR